MCYRSNAPANQTLKSTTSIRPRLLCSGVITIRLGGQAPFDSVGTNNRLNCSRHELIP